MQSIFYVYTHNNQHISCVNPFFLCEKYISNKNMFNMIQYLQNDLTCFSVFSLDHQSVYLQRHMNILS